MTENIKDYCQRMEQASDTPAIDRLHALAFGPGRFVRTAYRLRNRAAIIEEMCHVGLRGKEIVGSVRCSSIMIGSAQAVFLGPLAVHPDLKNMGIGQSLVRHVTDINRKNYHLPILLVGARDYFQRLQFAPVPPDTMILPAPVDQNRLLIHLPGADEEKPQLAVPTGIVSGYRPGDNADISEWLIATKNQDQAISKR